MDERMGEILKRDDDWQKTDEQICRAARNTVGAADGAVMAG
jgi:hypothetical protein